MHIVNKTSYTLLSPCGSGGVKEIPPRGLQNIFGEPIGKITNRDCYSALPGVLVCKEESDGNSHRVVQGNPLDIKIDGARIFVCHYLDANVLQKNSTPEQSPDWDQK